jgi:hypothetical protein
LEAPQNISLHVKIKDPSFSQAIYLWRKFSLFCFVVMRSTQPGCFRSCSWCLWKALDKEGCMGLVPLRLDLQCNFKFLNVGWFLHWKLNLIVAENSRGIGMCLWKDLDEQDLMEFIS